MYNTYNGKRVTILVVINQLLSLADMIIEQEEEGKQGNKAVEYDISD
jgi:hypothetical protein